MDRTFGSTTLIIHVPGTTRPGSLYREDYVSTDVYFPENLFREDERYSRAVSDLVQHFIKDIGLPTIARYAYIAARYWNLNKPDTTPPPYPPQGLQPMAVPARSSTFLYIGQVPNPDAVTVDDDDDPEKERLKEELNKLRSCLKKVQRFLGETSNREKDLLSEIASLSSSTSSSASRQDTPLVSRPSSQTTDRSKSSSPRSPVPQPPGASGSVAASSPLRQIGWTGANVSTGKDTSASPSSSRVKAESSVKVSRPKTRYGNFLKVNELEGKYQQIEKIRNEAPQYTWRLDLVDAGVKEGVVDRLMEIMSRQSLEDE